MFRVGRLAVFSNRDEGIIREECLWSRLLLSLWVAIRNHGSGLTYGFHPQDAL